MYMLEILRHVECDGVDDMARAVVLKLKLDMLEILAYEFGGSEVEHMA